MTSSIVLENPEKSLKGILLTVFPYTNSPLGTTTPTVSRLEIFPQKILSVEENTIAYNSVS